MNTCTHTNDLLKNFTKYDKCGKCTRREHAKALGRHKKTYRSPKSIVCPNCKNDLMNYDPKCWICETKNENYVPRPSLLSAQTAGDEMEVASIMRDMKDGKIVNII